MSCYCCCHPAPGLGSGESRDRGGRGCHCRGRSSSRDPGRVAAGCKDRSKRKRESVCYPGSRGAVPSITHFERLVVGATDEVAMADIVGPRDLGVGLAREGVAFQS